MEKCTIIHDFLEQHVTAVLTSAESLQEPLVSEQVGEIKGVTFNEESYRVYGKISKIAIHSDFWLHGLQITYQDHKRKETKGPKHGGGGDGGEGIFRCFPGDSHQITLETAEKITRVVVGTGAFRISSGKTSRMVYSSQGLLPTGTDLYAVVESITFFTSKGRKFGPYGKEGNPKAMEKFKDFYGEKLSSVLKTQEVYFGDDHYLGGIKGSENSYITSLAFVFLKDFSNLYKQDLSTRLEQAIAVLKEKKISIIT